MAGVWGCPPKLPLRAGGWVKSDVKHSPPKPLTRQSSCDIYILYINKLDNIMKEPTPIVPHPPSTLPLSPELLKELEGALRGMNFGYLTLVVQDGKVVQIEKTTKIRLTKSKE